MRGIAVAFCLTVLTLLTFGMVMLTSTSSFYAYHAYHGDAYYLAKRQALWMTLGLAACAATACVDYHRYRKFAWPLFAASVASLVAVLIFGKPTKGAVRWLVFGPFRFQPSELAKYALVIVLAFWLEKMQRPPKGQLRPRTQHWWSGEFVPLR